MTNAQLNKLWTTISCFVLIFSVDSWMRTQGIEPIFGSKLPHSQRIASAVFGYLVTSISMFFQFYVAKIYSLRQSGSFLSRLPIAFFKSLNMDQSESKFYQLFMYFFMYIVPFFALIHFFSIITKGSYHVYNDCCSNIINVSYSVWKWPEKYILDEGFRLGSCDGISFFPVIEPLLLAIMGIANIVLNLRYLHILKR